MFPSLFIYFFLFVFVLVSMVTCEVASWFSSKDCEVNIGFSPVNDRVWLLASSLRCLLVWHYHLEKMHLSRYQSVFVQIANCICMLQDYSSLTKPYPRDFPVLLSVITTASSMSPYTSKYFIRMMVRLVRMLGTTMRMVTSKCSLNDLSVVW